MTLREFMNDNKPLVAGAIATVATGAYLNFYWPITPQSPESVETTFQIATYLTQTAVDMGRYILEPISRTLTAIPSLAVGAVATGLTAIAQGAYRNRRLRESPQRNRFSTPDSGFCFID